MLADHTGATIDVISRAGHGATFFVSWAAAIEQ
jgi:hypothetical protein